MHRTAVILVLGMASGLAMAQSSTERIEFNGFVEGDIVRDQYRFRGVRFPADPNGGPFIDDGGGLGFLFDSPPGLLSLSPFARFGGPNDVHASVGTYFFDFVDPTNPFVTSYTDRVDVAVALIDHGTTVLTAYDAAGDILASQTLETEEFTFFFEVLSVSAPGITRATLTTPQGNPTLGCLLDTLYYNTPVVIPSRAIDIDVRSGSRNTIRLNDRTTLSVAVFSSPGFEPAGLDLSKVLFQQASPVTAQLVDRNHDRVPDLVLGFRVAELRGLTTASTEARLTAVDSDGTPLSGVDSVTVVDRGPSRIVLAPGAPDPSGTRSH
jgi:hypothetical protein